MVQQRLQLIVALEKLEDTKVVTRSRKAKDRQLIIQWPRKTDNRTNNDTPNITKDQASRTPLNPKTLNYLAFKFFNIERI
jgi:uncharacterized protein YeaC (DUF1315 family)